MKMHSLFSRLMQKSYVLFLFALLISLVIWVYMSFSANPSTDTTLNIADVAIQFESADESGKGFQPFGVDDAKVSVTVSGDRTVLGLVKQSDLIATASIAGINSADYYSLPVLAKKVSNNAGFDVTDWTPRTIRVFVDYLEVKDYPIVPDITYHIEEGYYGQTTLSPSSVMISGPRTEVQKIDRVVARGSVSGQLKESREAEAKPVLLDKDGNEISQKLLTLSPATVKASITVWPKKTVSVEPVFSNKPAGIKITEDIVTVNPSELQLAGPAEELNKTDSVKLDPIDFSRLINEKRSLTKDMIIPANCNNISNSATATVTIDLSSFSQKKMEVETFKVKGLSDNYNAVITTKSMNVTVYGSKSDIDKLKSQQITAVIDASNSSGKTGSVQLPVSFTFEGADTCWSYTADEANVIITKK